MNPFPRLRQSCRGNHRGSAAVPQGTRAGQRSEAAPGALGEQPRVNVNRVYLSGVLLADPQKDKGRDGEPVMLLLVAFPAPDALDTCERLEAASCEIEVPEDIAVHHAKELQAGGSIFIAGQLSGGGGVIATAVHTGPAPELG